MTKRKAPEDKIKAGRPSSYRDEYAEQARKLCLLGHTDKELASFFGVVEDTINEWKIRHSEFSASINAGKEKADAEIAEKLYHRARGYSHDAVKIFMPAGADDPVYAPYTEHYPPDTQAASLWLRNRQPAKWRDKIDHELTGKDGKDLVSADPSKVALVLLGILRGQDKPQPTRPAHSRRRI